MKILLTLHHPLDINAGAAGVTVKIGESYQKLGHTVFFYSVSDLPRFTYGNLGAFLFPFLVAWKIHILSTKEKIDIVYASSGDTWFWSKVLSKFFRGDKPILVTQSHGLEHTMHEQILEDYRNGTLKISWKYPIYRGSILLWKIAESFRSSDLCFMLNENEAKFLGQNVGVNPSKIKVIPNGIPDNLTGIKFRNFDIDESKIPGIALIGSYIDRKGIKYGVPVLQDLLDKYPGLKVHFLGTVCDPQIVYDDFSEKVHGQVKVTPYYNRDILPTLLEDSHILLFPSLYEGFPLAILEGMACSLAPITTEIPGPTEIVVHEVNGLLVPPRNKDELKKSLERLIHSRSDLNQLKYSAYQAVQQYSWGKIVQRHIEYYQELGKV